MFVVLIKYTAELDEIDRLMRDHVAFLHECYRAGVFLTSGRRVPRTGGVILARAESREDLDEVLRHDPFVVEGAATYEIVEFKTSLHHPTLAPFADPGTRKVRI
ncbi:MAG: GTP cyclohydrolase [bacterium]|nr:GTP cyclohydrolase [bacterium]